MSEKGSGVRTGRKIIREIVVTYRLEGDEKGEDRKLRVTNDGEGQVIDGVIWNDDLIRKLNYDVGGKCVPAGRQKPGKGNWRTTTNPESSGQKTLNSEVSGLTGECVWLHDESCIWEAYCSDT